MPHSTTSDAERNSMRVPGYFSVRAAADWLGIRERSVLELIERHRLASSRLGRWHFIPTRLLQAYRAERRVRGRHAKAGNRHAA